MPGQVNLAIGSKEKTVGWYDTPITSVAEAIRDLLENYSHIPADEVVPRIVETVSSSPVIQVSPVLIDHCTPSHSPHPRHTLTCGLTLFPYHQPQLTQPFQRDKIWDVFPWPCVGQFRFLDLSLSRQPSYPRILSLLQSGSVRLLDVGCCFAQDLRKFVRDGAPSSSLYGLEIQSEFIELGYEFFADRDSFRGRFINADLLDRSNPEVKKLEGTLGIVQLGMVLHIWDLEGQTGACERVVELLKDERGVLVVGQSVGNVEGKEFPARGRMIFKHDVETFGKMWDEVGRRTGTSWVVRARLDEGLGIDERKRNWDEPSTRRLSFEVERVA
ncbi:hypothetical protein GE09DRAFT_952277 [Coniochaeta sp. 2T2.1]|nr:hypothetical protein GE09DRAFT_952277 [Coniochaeta sp. 2T2.1]